MQRHLRAEYKQEIFRFLLNYKLGSFLFEFNFFTLHKVF